MRLYRVFPWHAGAAADEPGGVLYFADSQKNRMSNLDLYKTLYLAAEPQAAVAEVFGHLFFWRPETFVHPGGDPIALASFELPDDAPIFDLDDTQALRKIGVRRPSRIITRDRDVTHAWARRIFEGGKYDGARWWSYYCPDWTAYGLWNITALRQAAEPVALTLESQPVIEAAQVIAKQRVR